MTDGGEQVFTRDGRQAGRDGRLEQRTWQPLVRRPTGPRASVQCALYSTRTSLLPVYVNVCSELTDSPQCVLCEQMVLLSVARKKLNSNDLSGRVFVSSGLGGMSCAQAKAAQLAGLVALIAEAHACSLRTLPCVKCLASKSTRELLSNELLLVHAQANPEKVERSRRCLKSEVANDVERAVQLVREARRAKRPGVIVFQGNIVVLLYAGTSVYNAFCFLALVLLNSEMLKEMLFSIVCRRRLKEELEQKKELLVDLISDGSGVHNADRGGYIPEKVNCFPRHPYSALSSIAHNCAFYH